MAHTIDMACPSCNDLVHAEERTENEQLADGLITLHATCSHCGFSKVFDSLSPEEVQLLIETGLKVIESKYPEILEVDHPGFPTPLTNPPVIVTPDEKGWCKCPNCGFRFQPSSEYHFNGVVHMRCKQRLIINDPATNRRQTEVATNPRMPVK